MEYLKHFNPNHDPSNGRFTFGSFGNIRTARTTYKKLKKFTKNSDADNGSDNYSIINNNLKIRDEDINKLKKMYSDYDNSESEFYKKYIPEVEELAENYYKMSRIVYDKKDTKTLAEKAFKDAVYNYNWPEPDTQLYEKYKDWSNETRKLGEKYSSIYANKEIGYFNFKTIVEGYLITASRSPEQHKHYDDLQVAKNKFIAKYEKDAVRNERSKN